MSRPQLIGLSISRLRLIKAKGNKLEKARSGLTMSRSGLEELESSTTQRVSRLRLSMKQGTAQLVKALSRRELRRQGVESACA